MPATALSKHSADRSPAALPASWISLGRPVLRCPLNHMISHHRAALGPPIEIAP
jgi:hypothetical protein